MARDCTLGKPRALCCYCFLLSQYLLNVFHMFGSVLRAGGQDIAHGQKELMDYWGRMKRAISSRGHDGIQKRNI